MDQNPPVTTQIIMTQSIQPAETMHYTVSILKRSYLMMYLHFHGYQ